jgi:hypothetical protein
MALRRHVVTTFGADTWEALLVDVGTPGRLFTSLSDYPDQDVLALVGSASALLGVDGSEVLRGFGRSLVTDLLATYGSLVSATWTAFDLLEHTESTIHTVVRARNPSARPPVLTALRRGPELVALTYSSSRQLCALAQGIVLGIGDHFGTPLQVHEPQCMHKGAAACQLEVLPAFVAPHPREELRSEVSPGR